MRRHLSGPAYGAFVAAVVAVAWLATAPAAHAWTPEATSYGVAETQNVSITAADGTKLYGDLYYPTDPATGAAATGPFPVIITQTPYGKSDSTIAGSPDYLVQRGYIYLMTDVRGTGASEGDWGLFDPVQGTDGADWVKYAAALPHSDGKVGLLGESYMGINQFETAADSGPPGQNPVKAMFPIIASNDLYRDTAFAGGFQDIEFDAIYLGLMAGLNTTLPEAEGNSTFANALIDHVGDLYSFDAQVLSNVEAGGADAYDEDYWQQRNPNQYIQQIVKDGIPAYLVGGWYDLFLRGELLNYSSFQNAFDGRPLLAPMAPGQKVTPRYQLLMGPWYHVTAGDGLDYHGLDMNGLELAWFDHWLKGVDTGITDTATTMHLEDLGTGAYQEANGNPLDGTTGETYYLQPGGGLSTDKPPAAQSSDPLVFTGSQVPCTSSTDQWGAGLVAAAFGGPDPCTQNAALSQVGPGTVSYTTQPFTKATTIAGPIGATLYGTTTTSDAEWVVQLSDVAPNGQATSLTSGLLEGNQRALDGSMTWRAADGNPLLPWHDYTQAAQQPITPGQLTRFDVEVFPTFDTLEPGHRLRVTIATSDFPHALPTAAQLPNLLGGVYSLRHDAAAPSSVELPIVTGDTAGGAAPTPATKTPLGCPAATGTLTATRLGSARLGATRAATRRAFVASATSSTRRDPHWVYYCLSGSGIRVGYLGGHAALLSTSNRHYSLRGIRPGMKLSTAKRRVKLAKPFLVGRNRWYLVALGRRGRGVLKVQHGVVEEIGAATYSRVRSRALARRFFRSFN